LFFQDWSDAADGIIQDDEFQLLQSYSNVVITAHQAWFTRDALQSIADQTLSNINAFDDGTDLAQSKVV
jgi:D-lactate dehydrogenase